MSVMESLVTRRTYRRFVQKPVPQDVVDDIVEAVRLSSCGANRQALRLVVVQSPEMVAKVQPLVKWAAYLPPEQGMPKADETPTLYVAVLQDSSAPGDLSTDTGIALANMTLAAWDKEVGSCIMGAINKPALSEEQLYDRITRDFALLANHAAQGALVKLLPSSMQPVMVERWGIDPATKANQITREQKRELVQLVKHWRVSIDARGDLAHAVITSGGVSVREVDPKTMQSKKALGLYFAGEVLDVDAYTGGYNLQIAFCTAQAFANNL